MKPKLDILPAAQRAIWPKLTATPEKWVLYGGTAVALHLGHRESVDFDFFSSEPLEKERLLGALSFLRNSEQTQPEINTLDCFLKTDQGEVKFQFLAGLGNRQGRVEDLDICDDNGLRIPGLLDLFATKLNTIQARAEMKDYIDIEAIIKSGIALEKGLGAARAVYGPSFDPLTSLRALSWFKDGNLGSLSPETQSFLLDSVSSIRTIPVIKSISPTICIWAPSPTVVT